MKWFNCPVKWKWFNFTQHLENVHFILPKNHKKKKKWKKKKKKRRKRHV